VFVEDLRLEWEVDLRLFAQEAPTIIGSVEGTILAESSTEAKIQVHGEDSLVSCSQQLPLVGADWRSSIECEVSGHNHRPDIGTICSTVSLWVEVTTNVSPKFHG
jgi:hypothetical protein